MAYFIQQVTRQPDRMLIFKTTFIIFNKLQTKIGKCNNKHN